MGNIQIETSQSSVERDLDTNLNDILSPTHNYHYSKSNGRIQQNRQDANRVNNRRESYGHMRKNTQPRTSLVQPYSHDSPNTPKGVGTDRHNLIASTNTDRKGGQPRVYRIFTQRQTAGEQFSNQSLFDRRNTIQNDTVIEVKNSNGKAVESNKKAYQNKNWIYRHAQLIGADIVANSIDSDNKVNFANRSPNHLNQHELSKALTPVLRRRTPLPETIFRNISLSPAVSHVSRQRIDQGRQRKVQQHNSMLKEGGEDPAFGAKKATGKGFNRGQNNNKQLNSSIIRNNQQRLGSINDKRLSNMGGTNHQTQQLPQMEAIKHVRNFNDFINEIKRRLKENNVVSSQGDQNVGNVSQYAGHNHKQLNLVNKNVGISNETSKTLTRQLSITLHLQNERMELEKYKKLVEKELKGGTLNRSWSIGNVEVVGELGKLDNNGMTQSAPSNNPKEKTITIKYEQVYRNGELDLPTVRKGGQEAQQPQQGGNINPYINHSHLSNNDRSLKNDNLTLNNHFKAPSTLKQSYSIGRPYKQSDAQKDRLSRNLKLLADQMDEQSVVNEYGRKGKTIQEYPIFKNAQSQLQENRARNGSGKHILRYNNTHDSENWPNSLLVQNPYPNKDQQQQSTIISNRSSNGKKRQITQSIKHKYDALMGKMLQMKDELSVLEDTQRFRDQDEGSDMFNTPYDPNISLSISHSRSHQTRFQRKPNPVPSKQSIQQQPIHAILSSLEQMHREQQMLGNEVKKMLAASEIESSADWEE